MNSPNPADCKPFSTRARNKRVTVKINPTEQAMTNGKVALLHDIVHFLKSRAQPAAHFLRLCIIVPSVCAGAMINAMAHMMVPVASLCTNHRI